MRDRVGKCVVLLILCLTLSGCGIGHSQNSAVPPWSAGNSQGNTETVAPASGEGASLALIQGSGSESDAASVQESGSESDAASVQESSSEPDAAPIQGSDSDSGQVPTAPPVQEQRDIGYDFTICFAGDINLDENWDTTLFLDQQPDGIYGCISPELVEAMCEADIMCLNNEFTYSAGGAPLPGKAYTFRADPRRVEVLEQLGVDAVTLANNHVYDYGAEALLDTFAVLEEAGVPYFGAGRTLDEAMKPLYLEVEGKTIALVGASRAEKIR